MSAVRRRRAGSALADVSVLVVAPDEALSHGHRDDHRVAVGEGVSSRMPGPGLAASDVAAGGTHAQAEAQTAILTGRRAGGGQGLGYMRAGADGGHRVRLMVKTAVSCPQYGHWIQEDRRYEVELGTFSVSLSVRDLATSRSFYERLGFTVFHDASERGYLILRNGRCTIGLFQGMFEGNILTFNPGWDDDAQPLVAFTDVRDVQAALDDAGVELLNRADPDSDGPDNLMLTDPDGNVILLDQHVPRPGRPTAST